MKFITFLLVFSISYSCATESSGSSSTTTSGSSTSTTTQAQSTSSASTTTTTSTATTTTTTPSVSSSSAPQGSASETSPSTRAGQDESEAVLSSNVNHPVLKLDLNSTTTASASTLETLQDGNLQKKVLRANDGAYHTHVVLGDTLLWQPKEDERLYTCTFHSFQSKVLLVKVVVVDRQPTGEAAASESQTPQPRDGFYAYRCTDNDTFVRLYDEDYEPTLQRFKDRAEKADATLESVAFVTKNVRVNDSFTTPAVYIAIFAIAFFVTKI